MHCAQCNRNLARCICDDCQSRIDDLKKSPYLDTGMFELIEAERLLAKHEIDADREAARNPDNNSEKVQAGPGDQSRANP